MKNINFKSILAITMFVFIATSSFAHARKTASIVVEPLSGKVLYAKNANELAYPASLTKAMTVYMIFKALQRGKVTLRTKMLVSRNAARKEASKLYVKAGTHITVKTAIEALIVKSANDVATVVAEHFGKTERNFAKMMTRQAHSMGMKRTVFKNASGLPNRYQVTTARDMAQLGRRLLLDFPHFYHYFNKNAFYYHGRKYRGHNNVLNLYHGADGIKTGYIKASGFNLLTSAKRKGRRVVAVVLGGRTSYSRDNAMLKLLKKYTTKASLFALPTPRPQPFLQQAHAIKTPTVNNYQLANAVLNDSYKVRSPHSPYSTMLQKNRNIKQNLEQNQVTQTNAEHDVALLNNATWQVQVGAYYKKNMAGNMAERIYTSLPNVIRQHADYYISKSKKKKRNIYKARIKGLTEQQARKTCNLLKSQSFGCFVIKPI